MTSWLDNQFVRVLTRWQSQNQIYALFMCANMCVCIAMCLVMHVLIESWLNPCAVIKMKRKNVINYIASDMKTIKQIRELADAETWIIDVQHVVLNQLFTVGGSKLWLNATLTSFDSVLNYYWLPTIAYVWKTLSNNVFSVQMKKDSSFMLFI